MWRGLAFLPLLWRFKAFWNDGNNSLEVIRNPLEFIQIIITSKNREKKLCFASGRGRKEKKTFYFPLFREAIPMDGWKRRGSTTAHAPIHSTLQLFLFRRFSVFSSSSSDRTYQIHCSFFFLCFSFITVRLFSFFLFCRPNNLIGRNKHPSRRVWCSAATAAHTDTLPSTTDEQIIRSRGLIKNR